MNSVEFTPDAPRPSRFKRWVGELSPTCRVAAQLQSRALDGLLPPRQRFGLRLHTWLCADCRNFGRQVLFLREAFHRQARELNDCRHTPLPAEAAQEIKSALRLWPREH